MKQLVLLINISIIISRIQSRIYTFLVTTIMHKKVDSFGFFTRLVKDSVFKKIRIIYPIPGHSYLQCDKDFGLIEKIRYKTNKISIPSDYVKIVENAKKILLK